MNSTIGHRTKNKATMRTWHHTASHSITLPCSTTAWYSSTMTHQPSHAQTFYLQRDTNMSSHNNPCTYTTWPPAKCWSILLLQCTYLCLIFKVILVRLELCDRMTRPKMLLGLDVDINTWLFHLTSRHSKALSAMLNTLPKQEEVAACSSLLTLPTDRSKT